MTSYPDNWSEIRNNILLRAGGLKHDPRIGSQCEWCGVRNYSVRTNDVVFSTHNSYIDARRSANRNGGSVVVLTIAHIHDPNPANVDTNNLAALCQRCHNQHDAKMRRRHARQTKRQQRIDAGQLKLF